MSPMRKTPKFVAGYLSTSRLAEHRCHLRRRVVEVGIVQAAAELPMSSPHPDAKGVVRLERRRAIPPCRRCPPWHRG